MFFHCNGLKAFKPQGYKCYVITSKNEGKVGSHGRWCEMWIEISFVDSQGVPEPPTKQQEQGSLQQAACRGNCEQHDSNTLGM